MYVCVHTCIRDWKNWIWDSRCRDPGKKRRRKEKKKKKIGENGKLERSGGKFFGEPERVSLRNEHNIGLRYRWMHFGLAIRCPTQRYKEFVYPV